PKCDAKPRCLILHLARLVLAPFVGRHTKTADWCALRRVAQLGIATKITDKNYLVEGHEGPLICYGTLGTRAPSYAPINKRSSASNFAFAQANCKILGIALRR